MLRSEFHTSNVFCILKPFLVLWPLFSFLIIYTTGKTPWPGDQRVSRPLPRPEQHKHSINAHTYIHASSAIRTHSPRVQTSEDSSCLIPRGHSDRQHILYTFPETEETSWGTTPHPLTLLDSPFMKSSLRLGYDLFSSFMPLCRGR
jgi:hypothetical protein